MSWCDLDLTPEFTVTVVILRFKFLPRLYLGNLKV